jgi:oxygen-independent coproporphyrinogen-3 oxidase
MAEFLYIHMPYCVRKCIYCDFLSLPFDRQAARNYVTCLCRELELKRDTAGLLKAVFIGGGTPTLLPGDSFMQLFSCLRENFSFSPGIEISVEANPGTMKAKQIETLLSLGVNRISIGIQSFRDDELRTLGRVHTAAEALEAVQVLRNAGLLNFSLDLMYGIPGQTIETWKETLSTATGLSPAHVSAYELTPEEGTPLSHLIKTHAVRMPEEGLVLDMYSEAIDFLQESGYGHYEISNFALPGFRCRHNLNYWQRGEYIGAGAGAHSFIQGVRARNTGDIGTYIDSLANDVIPREETCSISPEDALQEFIFLGLRMREGIDMTHAEEMRPGFAAACAELTEQGYLVADGNRLRLTRKGLPLSNMVIVRIFESLGP